MIPQIDNQMNNDTQLVNVPSRTYKLKLDTYTTLIEKDEQDQNIIITKQLDRITGFVDNLDAVRQAALHILMTERYAYEIYDDNYGVELEQYIGESFDYLEASIEETLRDALTQDLRIVDVQVQNIEKVNNDTVHVTFNMISIYGDLQMEVNVNV